MADPPEQPTPQTHALLLLVLDGRDPVMTFVSLTVAHQVLQLLAKDVLGDA